MEKELQEVVIVAYGRSAVARAGKRGHLRNRHPVDFASDVLKGVLDRVPELDRSEIEDLVVGCAKPEGVQGNNMARVIAARTGLSNKVSGQTVNRFCSSGLQSIATASNVIKVGEADIMVAGGVETMTTIPMGYDDEYKNEWIKENSPGIYLPMGLTAENVAEEYNVTREAQDAFAVESHAKAAKAQDEGKFADEIIPILGHDDEGNEIEFKDDQGIRRGTSMETLSTLKTVFKEDGVVTAGQASQLSDGAGFVVLMSADKAKELNIKPIARFLGYAVGGVGAEVMGIGPIAAVPKVLDLLNLDIDDMDVIELNEAFAAQAIPVMDTLKMNKEKVNPNGGAIALGHPLGATGTILTCKALSELKRTDGKYGLITMCIGGGMGAAGIIEMC